MNYYAYAIHAGSNRTPSRTAPATGRSTQAAV